MATKTEDIDSWKTGVLREIENPWDVLELFDYLPQVYMYVKARDGRYLRVNRKVCQVVGVSDESDVVGRTDFDFFPPAFASQYVDEDQRVIKSGKALKDQIWLVPDSRGVPQIYSCNKVPLVDRQGSVIALAGIKRPYEQTDGLSVGKTRLINVVRYVTLHYEKEIFVADLAKQADLSSSQLHREFTRFFGITPNHYIREVRVGVARHLLESTQLALTQIALESGFYDQSYFTRQFKASTGLTPNEYRKKFSPFFDDEMNT